MGIYIFAVFRLFFCDVNSISTQLTLRVDMRTTLRETEIREETDGIKTKYVDLLEKMTRKRAAKVKEDMEKLSKETAEVKGDVEKVRKEIAELTAVCKERNRRPIFVEFGRRVEKALCKAVLGKDTRISSLQILHVVLQKNAKARQVWDEVTARIGWTDELWQMVITLKDSVCGQLPHRLRKYAD